MLANFVWSRSGEEEELLLLTACTWASGAAVAAAAGRRAHVALALGTAAGAALSLAVFLPLHRPAWMAAGVAASALAAGLAMPFVTYGDIALASRAHVRAATAILVLAWIAYLGFVRPLSTPSPAGQVTATIYECAIVCLAAAIARAAHRLTYGSRAERVWLAPIALALAFRDVPLKLLKAALRLALTSAVLVAAGTALVALLPHLVRPGAIRGKAGVAGHPPFAPKLPASASHPSSVIPEVTMGAIAAVALLLALAWVARWLIAEREAPRSSAPVRPVISQRRLEDAFRLVPTSEPVRARMQQRLRTWHEAGHTIGRGETVRAFARTVPGELRHPGDADLLKAYEEVRYGPDEP